MTLSKIKPWLVLALIFILGVATGVSLTIGLEPHFRHLPGTKQMKDRMLKGLTHRLNLTPEQQAKIDPILTAAENQIKAIRKEDVGRVAHVMETVDAQIQPLLTSDQQTELLKMRKEMEGQRDRMFPGHHMRPWMQPGSPGSPPPPDGPPEVNTPPDVPSGPPLSK